MKFSLKNLLFNVIMLVILFSVATPFVGEGVMLGICALLFAGSFVPNLYSFNGKGIAMTGLQKEIWEADIQEALYPGNEFMQHCLDNSLYVTNKTVHRPQAGTQPGVKKNRTQFPAQILIAEDDDETYDISPYTTDPIVVQDFTATQLSYDLRASILGRHMDVLKDRIAKDLLADWAPSLGTKMIRTSGAAVSTNLAASATGNRNRLTVDDLARLKRVLDLDNVPDDGNRFILMHPSLYSDLFSIEEIVRAENMGKTSLPDGVIRTLLGFNIIVRSYVPVFDNSGTPVVKDSEAIGATTDNLACIAWHKSYVDRAQGAIKVYENVDDATYYGDVLSAMVMFGGEKMRQTTQVGVAALIQQ